ncbi:hypothetical protein LEP1GSC073_3720 [Leptospira noguchii str. Cascata]|nr:hypothetical protein LEP1GSC072_1531 [Leptospira noguchii str. Bonito]EMS88532.1 hypothetical protein LEP1GSC073_3720 [Leptospira noguchii str. Cascata]
MKNIRNSTQVSELGLRKMYLKICKATKSVGPIAAKLSLHQAYVQ